MSTFSGKIDFFDLPGYDADHVLQVVGLHQSLPGGGRGEGEGGSGSDYSRMWGGGVTSFGNRQKQFSARIVSSCIYFYWTV